MHDVGSGSDENYDVSMFIENVIRYLIKHGKTRFECQFKRQFEKVTEKRFTTNLIVLINDNIFEFCSSPKTEREYALRLYKIKGSISNTKAFETLIDDLLDLKKKFNDDLYDGVFDDIDIDEIIDVCSNSCTHYACDNFICSMNRCTLCKFYDEDVSEIECSDENNNNIIDLEDILINIIDKSNIDRTPSQSIVINGVPINMNSLHQIIIKK